MSAINVFVFPSQAIVTSARRGCCCPSAREASRIAVPASQITPVVVPQWSIEKGPDGKPHLVRHWFENKADQQ